MLADLLAERSADRTAFLAARDERSVSYADLDAAARAWAATEVAGRTVALAVADPLDFAAAFLGLIAAGATVAPLDPRLDGEQIQAELADVGATLLVSDSPAAAGVPVLGPWPPASEGAVPTGDAGRVLLRSSGTTGPRKQIVLGERQLLHTARAIARHHRLGPGERGLSPLPLFHVNAEVVGLLSTVVSGAELVLDDRFHRDLWEVAERHGCTWVNAVPAMLAILSDCGRAPHGIRFVRSASAPLPVPVLERFEAASGVPVVETYGMTEAASQICANPVDGPRRPGSVGFPVETDLEIVDDAGRSCGPGTVGRVRIRGIGVIGGDSWLDTGDLGHRDDDGYVFLDGRVDDVINRGGEKVFPREVEAALLIDERVEEIVVVGAPHDVLGSVPVAFVIARTGSDPETVAADLHLLAERRLARSRRPVRIDVVEALPHGPTGKVSRGAVRSEAVVLSASALASA